MDDIAALNDLSSSSCAYWLQHCKVNLPGGQFSFKDHEYQTEPIDSPFRRICYMKGTQGGFTELEVLKTLHGLIYRRYPQGALYLFPTTDDVVEFSKSRFNPLIAGNKEQIGRFVKPGGRGTDMASLKKVNDAFLYLRGARLTQKVSGNSEGGESSKLRSIPVDRVVFDEVDLMDPDVIAKAVGRMGHSSVKEEVYISNPTIPDFGIDRIFQTSDQRHWFRKCGCGKWTCAELSFPECVKVDKAGKGYIGCWSCGKPLGIYPGEWVAQKTDARDLHGYRWSQLTSIYSDPSDILREFMDPPGGNLGDVYRLRLGLPYIAAEDRLKESEVYERCGKYVMMANHKGPCAMGVDVGKIKHVVIGIKTGKDRYEIIKTARVSEWSDIHDLAQRFGVKSAVVDIRPYEDNARQFQREEPYKVFLCEYSENSTIGTSFNDKTGVVKVNRTEVFDSTHRLIAKEMVTLPRLCPEIKEFAKQVCATAKVLETNKKSGTSIYRYKKLGDEHYRNALNYFYLASSGSRVSNINRIGKMDNMVADNDYARC